MTKLGRTYSEPPLVPEDEEQFIYDEFLVRVRVKRTDDTKLDATIPQKDTLRRFLE